MIGVVASIVFFCSVTLGGIIPKDEGITDVADPYPAYEMSMENEGEA